MGHAVFEGALSAESERGGCGELGGGSSSDGTPSGLCAPSADSTESHSSATCRTVQGRQGLGVLPARGSWRCRLPGPAATGRRAGWRVARGMGPARRSPGPQVPLTSWVVSLWLWVKLFPEPWFPHRQSRSKLRSPVELGRNEKKSRALRARV